MTNGVHEIEDAKLIFNFGYNGADSHPIVQRRIIRAKQKGAKIICADPRVVEAARIADIHLQLKGGTNLLLVYAMSNVIYNEKLYDKEFIDERTTGWEDFVKEISKDEYTPENVQDKVQIPAAKIREAAIMYATVKPAAILYGMGVCQFGQAVDVVKGLANLAMMTGNLGKHACGVGPVRGQNNVQGACDMGCLPNNFPGYQSVTNPDVVAKFEKAWGVKLSDKVGVPLTHVPEKVLHEADPKKTLHAYWIFGEDPAQTDPDLEEVRQALKKLDLVIVQDIFMNKTAEFADVFLPATTWCEHDGVYSSCDRGFQRIRKVIEPPKGVRVDWDIISEISTKMGYPMHYNNTEEIWDEMRKLCPSFIGATYAKMEKLGGVQWPCRSEDMSDVGTSTLHVGKFSAPDGKGKFYATQWRSPKELETEEYPLSLSTVREVGHYSCRTMTGNCRLLRSLEDEPGWVQMSVEDCKELDLKEGEIVKIESKRGWCLSRCLPTERMKKGATAMTYQWWIGACNELTNAVLDPISNTPEYKYCACRVKKIPDQKWAEDYVRNEYKSIKERMGIDKDKANKVFGKEVM